MSKDLDMDGKYVSLRKEATKKKSLKQVDQ